MDIGKRTALRNNILHRYGQVAAGETGSCCSSVPSSDGSGSACCGHGSGTDGRTLGYSEEDLVSVPEGANLGLGCGNPQVIAALKPGETVLDLGSGAGFDAFLAAKRVGPEGRVIGVDMTPQMVQKAIQNALKGGYSNVEFRIGDIESLPVKDASIDVIMSNCVINLSTDKPKVFAEAFRVLKPGGRLAVSDVVATASLPAEVMDDPIFHSSCIAGASTVEDLGEMLHNAGFDFIRIEPKDSSREFIRIWIPGSNAGEYIASASIQAIKPNEVMR
jgi:SAM-dependent methyltransferase